MLISAFISEKVWNFVNNLKKWSEAKNNDKKKKDE